tara:strand:+ start:1390 stop:1614 length:225 start_codon:yes stop_codon:yes gene_type:complete
MVTKRPTPNQIKADAKPQARARRAALNRKNRKEGTYGNGDGKDWAHKKGGGWKKQSASKNRSYNASGKRPRYSA